MPAELARLAQRLERVEELAEDAGARLARRPVDAAACIDRQALAQVGRHLLELHRMPRHQPERLDVHHEPVRRALGPAAHHLLGRHAVVRRVDLDGREALGVVREPLLRRRARRVPVLRERVVRPRARSDADRRRHRRRAYGEGPDSGPSPTIERGACAVALTTTDAFTVRRADGRVDARQAAERSAVFVQAAAPRSRRTDRAVAVWPVGTDASLVHERAVAVTRRRLAAARMNDAVAPPTFLPPAVVVIAALVGAAPFSVTADENLTCVRMTLT